MKNLFKKLGGFEKKVNSSMVELEETRERVMKNIQDRHEELKDVMARQKEIRKNMDEMDKDIKEQNKRISEILEKLAE